MASTPNMGLQQPTAGVDSGSTWENAVNNNSNILDQHNHSPGNGTPIPVTGISITTALPFNGNPATALQAAVFTAQPSLATLLAVYVVGNDLYYNDGAGNIVQVTSGGAVNATSSGISSGTATAAFAAGVLVVVSAPTVPANIQAGSILLGNNTAASKFLTLAPPSAMASNISQTLPTIPGTTSIMQMDSSGNMSAALTVDGATVTINANQIGVPASGIGTTQLATQSVTKVKQAAMATTSPVATAGNMAVSPYIGTQVTTTSASLTPVTMPKTVTMTIASPAVVTIASFATQDSGPLYAGMPVVFSTTGALPTGLTAGTTYFVLNPGGSPVGKTFNISATIGGSAINTTGSQSGTHTAKLAVLSLQITTTGRPVMIQLLQTANSSFINTKVFVSDQGAGTGSTSGSFGFVRTGTATPGLTSSSLLGFYDVKPNTGNISFLPGSLVYMDPVPAGTYQYVFNWAYDNTGAASNFLALTGCQLIAYEL